MSKSIFSQIISGTIPSYKIFEDEYVFSFLARDAIQLGHTLIVPKVEIDYFADVPEPYYTAVFQSAKPIAQAIHKVTGCKRVGTIIAGWDVPHFHYHLIPMFDYYDLDPKRASQRTHQDNVGIQQKIISQLSAIDTCPVNGDQQLEMKNQSNSATGTFSLTEKRKVKCEGKKKLSCTAD